MPASVRRWLPVAITLLLLSAVLIALKLTRIDQMQGDSALFFQVTEHIARYGSPISTLFPSIWTYQQGNLLTMPAAQMAHASLAPPAGGETNILRLHTYFILFPLGWLAAVLPVRLVLFTAYIVAYTGVLGLAYVLLVRRGVPVTAALLFCVLIVTYPAWGQTVLYGQFYPDRLFVLFGFVLMLVAAGRRNRTALVAAALCCAAVNERGALMAGIALVLYTLLYWRDESDRIFTLTLGCVLALVGLFLLEFVVVHNFYASFFPTDARHFIKLWQRPKYVLADVTFLMVNLPLLAFAFVERRAALIAVVAMLPNLFGSIGGGEKFGWTMHYQSFYMPFLLWAAVLGYARLFPSAPSRSGAKMPMALCAAALVYFSLMNPYTRPPQFALANVTQTFVPEFVHDVPTYFGPIHGAFVLWSGMITSAVPPGSVVSAPESAMPYLYRDRTIYFLPVGIDQADDVVLDLEIAPNGKTSYGGVLTDLPGDETAKINEMILARMRRDGYDMAHPTIVPGLGYAIFRRARR